MLIGVTVVAAGVPTFAFAASTGSVPSANTTATASYLAAVYAYEQASLSSTQASRAAMEAFTSKIGSECGGILKNAPPEASSSTSFAQRVGESKREDEQLGELESELGDAFDLILDQSERPAILAFVGATRSLRWTNPTITQLMGAEDASIEETLARAIPNACADMKTWVSSGYKTLSGATKELRAKREEATKKPRGHSTKPLFALLAPYEDLADKTLLARTATLAEQRTKALDGESLERQLDAVVGIVHETEEESISHHPAGAIHLLKYLHGGIRTLAHGRVPGGGPSFSIQGEAYSFIGKIQFALKVTLTNAGGGGESPSGQEPNIFSWALWEGCRPHPYMILYGLLKQPGDTVLARTAGKLRALNQATIPSHLHANGILVYTASSTIPSELIVRDHNNKTIITEKLGRRSDEALETCEAEAE